MRDRGWRWSAIAIALVMSGCTEEQHREVARDPVAELYAYMASQPAVSGDRIEPIPGFGRPVEVVTTPTPAPVAAEPEPSPDLTNIKALTLVGDSNRDGVIASDDLANRDRWKWTRGAIVPVNLDDDDRDGRPDALDRQLGRDDEPELALLRLLLPDSIPTSGAKLRIQVDSAARSYINVFQRTMWGWQAIDTSGKTPIIFSRNVVLGIEARAFATGDGSGGTWNGEITVEAIVEADRIQTVDRLQLRAAPWLMPSPIAPVETVFVTEIPATRQFAQQLVAIVEPIGVTVRRETVGTLWMQDTMELGYSQFPVTGDVEDWAVTPVVLDGVRMSSPGIYGVDRDAKTLLAPNFSLVRVATARLFPEELPKADRWIDWYGNLEVSPPAPGFPMGRIYYGRSNTAQFHPKLAAFLKSQQLQAPAVEIDTSWLYIRHVDEIIGFLPHPDGGHVATIVSSQAGLDLLLALQASGAGTTPIALPDGQQTSVDRLLANSEWVAHNQAIERQQLARVRQQLRNDFGLTADRIVALPAVFTRGGQAIWSNPVNALWVNGTVIIGDPNVASAGGDPVRSAIEAAIGPLGIKVAFIDDGYYHRRNGNVHCATNTQRQLPALPFWQTLPPTMR